MRFVINVDLLNNSCKLGNILFIKNAVNLVSSICYPPPKRFDILNELKWNLWDPWTGSIRFPTIVDIVSTTPYFWDVSSRDLPVAG